MKERKKERKKEKINEKKKTERRPRTDKEKKTKDRKKKSETHQSTIFSNQLTQEMWLILQTPSPPLTNHLCSYSNSSYR